MKVFVLLLSAGSYDDWWLNVAGVFADKPDAEARGGHLVARIAEYDEALATENEAGESGWDRPAELASQFADLKDLLDLDPDLGPTYSRYGARFEVREFEVVP